MWKVCQQNIKVKSINVTREQSWAVYGEGEQGAAERTFLRVPTALLSLPSPTASAGTFLPPLPLGLQNPFFFKLLNPSASRSSWLCLLRQDGCREEPMLPCRLSGQSTGLWGSRLTAAFPPGNVLGQAGAVWGGIFIAS